MRWANLYNQPLCYTRNCVTVVTVQTRIEGDALYPKGVFGETASQNKKNIIKTSIKFHRGRYKTKNSTRN
jgi:hypothetical protein